MSWSACSWSELKGNTLAHSGRGRFLPTCGTLPECLLLLPLQAGRNHQLFYEKTFRDEVLYDVYYFCPHLICKANCVWPSLTAKEARKCRFFAYFMRLLKLGDIVLIKTISFPFLRSGKYSNSMWWRSRGRWWWWAAVGSPQAEDKGAQSKGICCRFCSGHPKGAQRIRAMELRDALERILERSIQGQGKKYWGVPGRTI